MIVAWLSGLARTRTGTVLGTVAGIAITVGFLVAIGAFMRSSAAEMTARATGDVPIDWQVELLPGASADTVAGEMRSAARIARLGTLGYAATDGFEASTGGTVQVTGPGAVLGIERSYATDFPGNIRLLLGKPDGTLIAQQTAANLHVAPGDSVIIHRPGSPDATVAIDGVIDLPNADSLFQAIGVPAGAAPQAPPDNVLLLPIEMWHALFDPQAGARPDTVRTQIHARLDRANLASDPQAAFLAVTGEGRNFEVRVAGSALLANNLAKILDTTREDALYARVLFFFLGAPGVVAAVLLTIAVAHSGAARRRRDQSLLRLRGAATGFLLKLAAAEALAVGIAGSAIGIVVGELVSEFLLSGGSLASGNLPWLGGAASAGIVLALAAVLAPAWLDARHLSIASARSSLAGERHPYWALGSIDVVLLAVAAIIFWRTAQSGYQIVLAPEGVAAVSVDYWAFLAPLFFWLGMGLLALRLTRLALRRAQLPLTVAIRPLSGSLATLIVSALARQPRRIAAGVGLSALALGFAISISIFNATYQAQSRVDAELTNGADVTVTGTAAAAAGQALDRLAALPGVAAAVPLQHRFAYVGTDLQDVYGIDPATIGRAATMSNAYFGNGDAPATLAALQSTPDGVLVSAETVTDFQLEPGDTINLRLQSASDHQYHVAPFRFVGVAREFPTAPRDSFLVANATYLAKMTGSAAAEIVLIRATADPARLRDRVAEIVKDIPGAKVRDITEARKLIGSSLTAIDLNGLTRLELAYAVVLAACAAGLVLALGVLDRRRSFAVMVALGAKPKQLMAFLRGEAAVIFVAGSLLGALTGVTVAWMLVALLTGVFDPPPDGLTIPWLYLVVLFAAVGASVALAVGLAERRIEVSPILVLREESR
jgi:putative ABC transport system permease protein